MQAGLVPDAYVGMGNTGVGCFKPAAGITNGGLQLKYFVECPRQGFTAEEVVSRSARQHVLRNQRMCICTVERQLVLAACL